MISPCRTVRMTSYKDTSPLHKSFLGEKKNSTFPVLKLLVDQVISENTHILPNLAHAVFPRGPA